MSVCAHQWRDSPFDRGDVPAGGQPEDGRPVEEIRGVLCQAKALGARRIVMAGAGPSITRHMITAGALDRLSRAGTPDRIPSVGATGPNHPGGRR